MRNAYHAWRSPHTPCSTTCPRCWAACTGWPMSCSVAAAGTTLAPPPAGCLPPTGRAAATPATPRSMGEWVWGWVGALRPCGGWKPGGGVRANPSQLPSLKVLPEPGSGFAAIRLERLAAAAVAPAHPGPQLGISWAPPAVLLEGVSQPPEPFFESAASAPQPHPPRTLQGPGHLIPAV